MGQFNAMIGSSAWAAPSVPADAGGPNTRQAASAAPAVDSMRLNGLSPIHGNPGRGRAPAPARKSAIAQGHSDEGGDAVGDGGDVVGVENVGVVGVVGGDVDDAAVVGPDEVGVSVAVE